MMLLSRLKFNFLYFIFFLISDTSIIVGSKTQLFDLIHSFENEDELGRLSSEIFNWKRYFLKSLANSVQFSLAGSSQHCTSMDESQTEQVEWTFNLSELYSKFSEEIICDIFSLSHVCYYCRVSKIRIMRTMNLVRVEEELNMCGFSFRVNSRQFLLLFYFLCWMLHKLSGNWL